VPLPPLLVVVAVVAGGVGAVSGVVVAAAGVVPAAPIQGCVGVGVFPLGAALAVVVPVPCVHVGGVTLPGVPPAPCVAPPMFEFLGSPVDAIFGVEGSDVVLDAFADEYEISCCFCFTRLGP
jgi:hypothetical protein